MLVNEYRKAVALSREKDEKQLTDLREKSGKIRDVANWIGIVSLFMMTAGQYLLVRYVSGYADSGIDRLVLLGSGLGFAVTLVMSSRGREKTDLIDLALTLKRQAASGSADHSCRNESKER